MAGEDSALIGREAAAASLRALLEQHRVVFVYGSAGVGKTALVLAVAAQAAREGVVPPVVHLSLPGAVLGRDAVERTAKAIGEPRPRLPAERIAESLAVLLTSAPHTVIWDDVDEHGGGLLDVVKRFDRREGTARLVIVSRRFVTTSEASLRVPVFEVEPLAPAAAMRLVHALEEERGRTLVDDLVEATGGNPLLLRIALADAVLPRVGKNATDALRRAVEERVVEGGPARDVLAVLAAAGLPLAETEIVRLAGRAARAAIDDLRKHLLVVRGAGDTLGLAPPVQSLAMAVLGEPEAATWRALVEIAERALATSAHDDAALLLAGRARLALGEPAAALRTLRERTLARAAAPTSALETLLRDIAAALPEEAATALRLLARELLRASDYESAQRALDELPPPRTDDDAERIALLRAECYVRAGEPEAAQHALDALARGRAAKDDDSPALVMTRAQLAIFRGDIEAARATLEALAPRTAHVPQLEARRAVAIAGSYLYGEQYALTQAYTLRARAAQKAGGVPVERIVTILEVQARLGLGELDQADEVLARDERSGPDGPLAIATLVRRGEHARALEAGDRAVAALDQRADRLFRSILARDLVRAAIGTGELARADRLMRLAEIAGNDPGLAALGPFCDAERARLAEAEGDGERARASIARAFAKIPGSPFVSIDRDVMNGLMPRRDAGPGATEWPPVAQAYARLRSGEHALATGALSTALESADLAERHYLAARLWHETARARLVRGEALARTALVEADPEARTLLRERAGEALSACEELAVRHGYVPLRLGAALVRAALAEAAGQPDDASRALAEVVAAAGDRVDAALVRAAARFGITAPAPPASTGQPHAARVTRLGLLRTPDVTWRIGSRTYLLDEGDPPPEPVSCIVDVDTRQVRAGDAGRELQLPEQRLALIALLAEAGADGASLEEIFERVWGGAFHPLRHRNAVYVALARLKDSLKPFGDEVKVTHEGERYRLTSVLPVATRRVGAHAGRERRGTR